MSKISKSWRGREAEGLTRRERIVVGSVELAKVEAPAYPSTPVASPELLLLAGPPWLASEKLDGANCAVWIDADGAMRIRDRNRALRKGVRAGGWAKKQFAPLWGRAGEAKEGVLAIERSLGFRVALYAEWLLIDHGRFVDPVLADGELVQAGFSPPAALGAWDPSKGWAEALALAVGESALGGPREGVVFKRGDGVWQTGLCKLVDPSFQQGSCRMAMSRCSKPGGPVHEGRRRPIQAPWPEVGSGSGPKSKLGWIARGEGAAGLGADPGAAVFGASRSTLRLPGLRPAPPLATFSIASLHCLLALALCMSASGGNQGRKRLSSAGGEPSNALDLGRPARPRGFDLGMAAWENDG